jgi:hypothetical protein
MAMKARHRLPLTITLMTCLVLSTTAWNIVRVLTAVFWRQALESYAPRPGPFYIGFTGLVWVVTGGLVAWSLMRRSWWALNALRLAGTSYAVWIWLDRSMVQSGLGYDWILPLAATVALLAYTWAFTFDARTQAHFGREAD